MNMILYLTARFVFLSFFFFFFFLLFDHILFPLNHRIVWFTMHHVFVRSFQFSSVFFDNGDNTHCVIHTVCIIQRIGCYQITILPILLFYHLKPKRFQQTHKFPLFLPVHHFSFIYKEFAI